jgi:hypothetical protein
VHKDTYGLQHFLNNFEQIDKKKRQSSCKSVGSYAYLSLYNYEAGEESKFVDITSSDSIDGSFMQNNEGRDNLLEVDF